MRTRRQADALDVGWRWMAVLALAGAAGPVCAISGRERRAHKQTFGDGSFRETTSRQKAIQRGHCEPASLPRRNLTLQ